ncbi:MAG: YfcE family phosphodiesterase [Candidatus Omnitrophica bacterium]|nr:YfcE family phosphodiesterase [Candidatus Omnitrophota bacterium]
MKIGVIADTHIPDRAKAIPQQILNAFKKVDMVIHAGDLVDIKVLEELKSVCNNVKAVYGNMDNEETQKILPQKIVFKVGSYNIGVTHGFGASNHLLEYIYNTFKDDKVDIVIFGHAHTPFNKKINGILYFNPGSPTDKVFTPYNSYGIIEINGDIEAEIIKL